MKTSHLRTSFNSFKFTTLDQKNFKPNKHYDMNNKSTKDKFRTNKTVTEDSKILEKEENNLKGELLEDTKIKAKEKYKAFSYNFPDEESKKRFEDYTEYTKYQNVMRMNHNSVFKIKNFFVRRNFLKRKSQEKNDSFNDDCSKKIKEEQRKRKSAPHLRGLVLAAGCKKGRRCMKRDRGNKVAVPLQSGHTSR